MTPRSGILITQRTFVRTLASFKRFVPDHLGSVAVVVGASSVTHQSFDAWGRQRNEDGSDDATCSLGLSSPTTRGFTGQEEIAALCLVDFNARLYDPTLGKFLSADSMVPDPTDGQSYNRYTYVRNRPLSLTDPTGNSDTPFAYPPGGALPPGYYPDPTSNPGMSCAGNCPVGSSPGSSDVAGTTLWDRISASHGVRNIKVRSDSNGNQILDFACEAGSDCESIGNSAVAANGGTITGENERDRFASFLNQLGGGVAYVEAAQNTYRAYIFFDASNSSAFANAAGSTIVSGSRVGNESPGEGKSPYSRLLTHADYSWIPVNGYGTSDEAGKAGLGLADNLNEPWLEYGGGTVNIGDRFWFTMPVTRGLGYHFGATVETQGGALAGLYHTHPSGYQSLLFSSDDVNMAETRQIRSLIGTYQDHAIHYYDPRTMSPTTIKDGANWLVGVSKGEVLCEHCFGLGH